MVGLAILLQALTVAVSGPPTSSEYLPLRVAHAEGYFESEGLSVTLKTTRAEVGAAEALAQGQADLVATSLEGMLRFGPRRAGQTPRLVLGLTAAPPVALVVPAALADTIQSFEQLAGRPVGVAAPGAPEHPWLSGLLARTRLRMSQVDLMSLGRLGVATGIARGEVHAGLVEEPHAGWLVAEGARVLADLRSPEAVERALGVATVNAAVFVRNDRRPRAPTLAAFARAVLRAIDRIRNGDPEALAARLPRAVVGSPEIFARRLQATRAIYLPDAMVDADRLGVSIALIRAHHPLPATSRTPRAEAMLHTGPLKEAIERRPK